MKVKQIVWIGCAAVGASAILYLVFMPPDSSMESVNDHRAMEIVPIEADPVVQPVEKQCTSDLEEFHTPVEPVEGRGDAMLFEIDALQGTPFDQEIISPFD